MRTIGRNTFENFWTIKNSHFGPKHDVFGPKFGFLLSLTIYIEEYGHMIAQNDALDETKKLGYRKNFAPPKNGPLGPKMAIFGQKLQVLAKNRDF